MQSTDIQLLPIVAVGGATLLYLVVVCEYLKRGRRLSRIRQARVGEPLSGWGSLLARATTSRMRSALLHGLLLSSVLAFFWIALVALHGLLILPVVFIMLPLLPLVFVIGLALGYEEGLIPPSLNTQDNAERLRTVIEWLAREQRSGNISAENTLNALLRRDDALGEEVRRLSKELEGGY